MEIYTETDILLYIIIFSVEIPCQHSLMAVAIQNGESLYSCLLMLIIMWFSQPVYKCLEEKNKPQILCKKLLKVKEKRF